MYFAVVLRGKEGLEEKGATREGSARTATTRSTGGHVIICEKRHLLFLLKEGNKDFCSIFMSLLWIKQILILINFISYSCTSFIFKLDNMYKRFLYFIVLVFYFI